MIPGYVAEDLSTKTTYKDREQKVMGAIEKEEKLGSGFSFSFSLSIRFRWPDTIMNERIRHASSDH